METQGNDYKYIMEGLTEIAVGTRYTYAELEDNPELSYKFRCIIKRFFEQEVGRKSAFTAPSRVNHSAEQRRSIRNRF